MSLMVSSEPQIHANTGSFRIYAGHATMPGGDVASGAGGGFGFLTVGSSYTYDAITSVFTDNIRFQLKDAYKFNLTKNIDYDLSFKAVVWIYQDSLV